MTELGVLFDKKIEECTREAWDLKQEYSDTILQDF